MLRNKKGERGEEKLVVWIAIQATAKKNNRGKTSYYFGLKNQMLDKKYVYPSKEPGFKQVQ